MLRGSVIMLASFTVVKTLSYAIPCLLRTEYILYTCASISLVQFPLAEFILPSALTMGSGRKGHFLGTLDMDTCVPWVVVELWTVIHLGFFFRCLPCSEYGYGYGYGNGSGYSGSGSDLSMSSPPLVCPDTRCIPV